MHRRVFFGFGERLVGFSFTLKRGSLKPVRVEGVSWGFWGGVGGELD